MGQSINGVRLHNARVGFNVTKSGEVWLVISDSLRHLEVLLNRQQQRELKLGLEQIQKTWGGGA